MKLELHWTPREAPLSVEGCLAEGESAQRLRHNLARREATSRKKFRAVEVEEGVLLLGPDLPWVEGLVYLGRVGSLYLPTLWQPNLPVEWLEARLKDFGDPPWALLPSGKVIGLSQAEALW